MSVSVVTSKSTVFVLGGGGNVGSFVVDGLLHSGNFRVIVLARPQSEDKPRIQTLKKKGAEIRLGDLSKLSIAELEIFLNGVDIVLSLVNVTVIDAQKKVFQAAKNVGVKRVVPSDFTIVYPPEREPIGIKQKLGVRSFVKTLGIDYTFIDVGWWMDVILPFPTGHEGTIADLSHTFVDAGDVKTAVTCREDIGHFVARILVDPRTVNAHVFCHAEEATQSEIYRIAEEVSGEKFESAKIRLSAEAIAERLSHAEEDIRNLHIFKIFMLGYFNSVFVHGDNTLETARKLGALDALALYPDFKPKKLKEFAVEFYRQIPRFSYGEFNRE